MEGETSNANFLIYVKKIDHGIIVIVIYVDDLIIIGDNDADIKHILQCGIFCEAKSQLQIHGYTNVD
jgi:hypothetical protein